MSICYKFPKVKNVSKFDDDFLEGKLELSEKMDGANFSFLVSSNNELVFRSRRRELSEDELTDKMWWPAVEYIRNKHKEYPFKKGFVFYGERMFKHTIDYGDDVPVFIGFAVYDIELEKFLEDWRFHYTIRDIPVVPTLTKPVNESTVEETRELIKNFAEGTSWFGELGVTKEGVVVKRYDIQEFAKHVNVQFKEENRRVFGDSEKTQKMTDTEKIVNTFCTTARIKKSVYDLIENDGYEFEMRMMEKLPFAVYEDIILEEFWDIEKKYKEMNFKEMRHHISKKCSKVLQGMIYNLE